MKLNQQQIEALQRYRASKQVPQQTSSASQAMADPSVVEDVVKSAAYRGLPEAAAAANPVGMALNLSNLVAEGVRGLGGMAYEGITGEELPRYGGSNPIPTTSGLLKQGAEALGTELYEPKTTPGKYARTATEFVVGGKVAGRQLPKGMRPSVKQLAGAGLASEAAGQATEGVEIGGVPIEVPARLITGYLAGRVMEPKAQAVAAQKVKEMSRAKYADAEAKGGVASAKLSDDLADATESLLPKTKGQKIIRGSDPDFEGIAERMNSLRGERLSFNNIKDLDEEITKAINSPKGFTEGRVTPFGKQMIDLQDKFRNLVDDLPESQVSGGKAGVQAWREAQKLYSASRKLDDIENVIYRADLTRNPTASMQSGLRALAVKAKKRGGYSKKEIAMLERAAKDGNYQDLIRTLGSRLIPIFGIASGNASSAAALAGGAMASRKLSEAAKINQAAKLQNEISRRAAPELRRANAASRSLIGTTAATPSIESTRDRQAAPKTLNETQLRALQEYRRTKGQR